MKSNQDIFLQVFEQAPVAIIVSDANDKILFTNMQARSWFAPINNYPTIEGILDRSRKTWLQMKSHALNGEFVSYETKVHLEGLSDIMVFCRKITCDGEPAIVSFLRDLTEQRRLEKELTGEKNIRELILDSIPAMVFVKDDKNHIVSMNRTYRELTGLSMEKLAGKNLIHAVENRRLAENNWKDDLEVIETGLPKRNIIEPMLTDEKKWFITDKIPYRDEQGQVKGVIGFSIDITERKNAEDALMRSEKKWKLLFDSAPDGIVISDLEGNFISTNQAFRNLLGYDHHDVVRMNFKDISPEKYPNDEGDFINNALKSDQVFSSFEKEYSAHNKTMVPVAVTCWMLNDEVGNPIQMVANVKDLTYKKRAEALERSLLQKEKEQLEKDLFLKNQQLNSKVTQLVEKNEMVSNVIGQLQKLKKQGFGDVEKNIDNIIRDLKLNSSEDFWAQFETTFGQINQSFYENLFKAYPNLTNNERKLSAFLKMNLSTKDISNITHQSIRSIEMARSRLRAKLNLSRKENLSKFLNQF